MADDLTLDELIALRKSLLKRRLSGVQSTQHGDTRTQNMTGAEMAEALRDIEARIAALSVESISRVSVASFSSD
jgi:hypothetical protein